MGGVRYAPWADSSEVPLAGDSANHEEGGKQILRNPRAVVRALLHAEACVRFNARHESTALDCRPCTASVPVTMCSSCQSASQAIIVNLSAIPRSRHNKHHRHFFEPCFAVLRAALPTAQSLLAHAHFTWRAPRWPLRDAIRCIPRLSCSRCGTCWPFGWLARCVRQADCGRSSLNRLHRSREHSRSCRSGGIA